jgi:hypothetical protein
MKKADPQTELGRDFYFNLGIAIAHWQQVELALTQLFVILIQAEGGAASAALNSVQSFRTRVQMVRAAAAVRLKAPLLDECMKICERLEDKARKRNQLAHYMVMTDIREQDGRLLADYYLSPSFFDGAKRWRHGNSPPKLSANDFKSRTASFDKISGELWEFSEKVKIALDKGSMTAINK